MTILLSAILAAATLQPQLDALARLPGEPQIVSAAGIAKSEEPILTIENAGAFDPAPAKRRLVILGSAGDETAGQAVIDAVRWLKTSAPDSIKTRWIVSAMPMTAPDPTEAGALTRWVTFQAPDLIVEVGSTGTSLQLPDVRIARVPAASVGDVLPGLLTPAAETSALHKRLVDRVQRPPLDIARVLAKRYPETPGISYIPSVAWNQTLRLSAMTGDASLRAKVLEQTKPWLIGEKKLFGDRIQLTSIAGTLIFAELAASGEAAAGPLADEGATFAAKEKSPSVPEYGQGWTDDMFMASAILTRMNGRPGHERDMDVAARLVIAYAAKLQQPSGLFNHAVDGPAAWGRGNGFAALGLFHVLSRMRDDDPLRPRILDIFRTQMSAVRRQQAPDGMWRQIIDDPAAYREETATAMLLTAMARGIRLGWLDQSYRPIVDRAWRALSAHVVGDGTVIDVCTGTGSGPTQRYYFDRQAITGADDRGGAMALLASMEMAELLGRR